MLLLPYRPNQARRGTGCASLENAAPRYELGPTKQE
jgi:hypothetical protein